MERDRSRGRGTEEWNAEEWPGSGWEEEEEHSQDRTPRIETRPKNPPAREGGVRIEADLGHVMDDPLYEALPGAARAGRAGHSRSARVSAKGIPLGQKLLIWLGFAIASGISFGAGLLIGASGGLDVPEIPFLSAAIEGLNTEASRKIKEPGLSAESVIEFGEKGHVPSPVKNNALPFQTEPVPADKPAIKAEAEGTARPEEAGTALTIAGQKEKVEPPPDPSEASGVTREAEAPAEEPLAQETAPEGAPEGTVDDPATASELTFYDTATGKREVPGLEAPPREEADKPIAPPTAVSSLPGPSASDAADAQPVSVNTPEPQAVVKPAAGSQEAPSGAELLAQRRSQRATASRDSPRPAGGSEEGSTYTVQVMTTPDQAAAQAMVDRLTQKGLQARVDPLARRGSATLYRVRVGHYGAEADARQDLERLQSEPGAHPYIRLE